MNQVMSMAMIQETEVETCEVSEDSRCQAEATRVVREPWTPAAFKVRCCAQHAADLIAVGYSPTCNECEEPLDYDLKDLCRDCASGPEPESNWSAQYRSDSGGLLT